MQTLYGKHRENIPLNRSLKIPLIVYYRTYKTGFSLSQHMIKFKSESAVHLSELDAKSAVYNIALMLLMYLLEELDGTMICSKIINFFRRGMSYSAYFENTLRLTSCFKYVPRIPTKGYYDIQRGSNLCTGCKGARKLPYRFTCAFTESRQQER